MQERFRDSMGEPWAGSIYSSNQKGYSQMGRPTWPAFLTQAHCDQLSHGPNQKATSRWAGLSWPVLTMTKSDTSSSRVQIRRLEPVTQTRELYPDKQAYHGQLFPWPNLVTLTLGPHHRAGARWRIYIYISIYIDIFVFCLFSQILGSQNVQTSTCRPPDSNHIKKPRPTYW